MGTDELFRERGYVALSRGRFTNRLYLLGATPTDHGTSHGPPPRTGDPVDLVHHALHRYSDKRLAIDTGEPLALWPIDDLVAEHHRLTGILDACPPDRSHDIAALTTRRENLEAEIEPLVYRYNELADRKLRGPGTRSEMRDLRGQIGALSDAGGRLTTELDNARNEMNAREQFHTDHAHDTDYLAAVDHELDRQLRSRAQQVAADPTDYHLHILGPVPTDPDHQATWMRGATILERHDIGLDPGPTNPPHVGLATLRDVAETRARLEAMAIPGAARPAGQAVQPNHGIELG